MLQPTQVRALSKRRCHGEHSPQSAGCHESCAVRNTRSGCGIMIVTRPSAFDRPAMPFGEPFGFAGYVLATAPALVTKRIDVSCWSQAARSLADANSARP